MAVVPEESGLSDETGMCQLLLDTLQLEQRRVRPFRTRGRSDWRSQKAPRARSHEGSKGSEPRGLQGLGATRAPSSGVLVRDRPTGHRVLGRRLQQDLGTNGRH